MLCLKCNTQNPENSRFCGSCGSLLGVTSPPKQSTSIVTSSSSLIPVKELFKNTWDLYSKCWQNLLLISLLTIVVWKVWRVIVMPTIIAGFGLGALLTRDFSSGIGVALLGLAAIILTWMVVFGIGFWGSAAMVFALNEANKGTALKIADVYREAKKLLWPLSVVSLWVFLIVLGGLIFLIIPGIILGFLLQFTNFVVVAEKKTGFGALKRSMSLVGNNFLGIFGRNLLMGLVIFLVNIIFGKMLFFNIASQILVLPFALVYHYLVYKSALTRETNYDLPKLSN